MKKIENGFMVDLKDFGTNGYWGKKYKKIFIQG